MIHTAVNVTTTSAKVLDAATVRRALILQNVSDTDMWLKLDGSTAAANTGFYLAKGTYLAFTAGVAPVAQINAIHAGTGNKVLLISTL